MSKVLNKKAIISLGVDKLIRLWYKDCYIENFVLLCIHLVKQNDYENIDLEKLKSLRMILFLCMD